MAMVRVVMVGRFAFAGGPIYNAGERAAFDESIATELLEGGHAVRDKEADAAVKKAGDDSRGPQPRATVLAKPAADTMLKGAQPSGAPGTDRSG